MYQPGWLLATKKKWRGNEGGGRKGFRGTGMGGAKKSSGAVPLKHVFSVPKPVVHLNPSRSSGHHIPRAEAWAGDDCSHSQSHCAKFLGNARAQAQSRGEPDDLAPPALRVQHAGHPHYPVIDAVGDVGSISTPSMDACARAFPRNFTQH